MKRRNVFTCFSLTAISFIGLSTSAYAEDSPWHFDIGGSIGYNNNLGQAERSRDIVEVYFGTITAGIDYKKELWHGQQLTLRGFLETEQVEEVRDMSRLTAGGKFLYDWQPGSGPTASTFQINLGLKADEYGDDNRSSTVFDTQLLATKPFSEKINATIGVEYRKRDSNGTVWDLSHVRGFLGGTFNFYRGWSAYGTYSYIDGDVWSTAQTIFCDGTPANDIFGLVSEADALEPDEAFNKAFCGNWIAYRLPAISNTFELGVNADLGHELLLDFSAKTIHVDARGDNNYNTQIFRVSLLKRF